MTRMEYCGTTRHGSVDESAKSKIKCSHCLHTLFEIREDVWSKYVAYMC
jgi:hypothetical protein